MSTRLVTHIDHGLTALASGLRQTQTHRQHLSLALGRDHQYDVFVYIQLINSWLRPDYFLAINTHTSVLTHQTHKKWLGHTYTFLSYGLPLIALSTRQLPQSIRSIRSIQSIHTVFDFLFLHVQHLTMLINIPLAIRSIYCGKQVCLNLLGLCTYLFVVADQGVFWRSPQIDQGPIASWRRSHKRALLSIKKSILYAQTGILLFKLSALVRTHTARTLLPLIWKELSMDANLNLILAWLMIMIMRHPDDPLFKLPKQITLKSKFWMLRTDQHAGIRHLCQYDDTRAENVSDELVDRMKDGVKDPYVWSQAVLTHCPTPAMPQQEECRLEEIKQYQQMINTLIKRQIMQEFVQDLDLSDYKPPHDLLTYSKQSSTPYVIKSDNIPTSSYTQASIILSSARAHGAIVDALATYCQDNHKHPGETYRMAAQSLKILSTNYAKLRVPLSYLSPGEFHLCPEGTQASIQQLFNALHAYHPSFQGDDQVRAMLMAQIVQIRDAILIHDNDTLFHVRTSQTQSDQPSRSVRVKRGIVDRLQRSTHLITDSTTTNIHTYNRKYLMCYNGTLLNSRHRAIVKHAIDDQVQLLHWPQVICDHYNHQLAQAVRNKLFNSLVGWLSQSENEFVYQQVKRVLDRVAHSEALDNFRYTLLNRITQALTGKNGTIAPSHRIPWGEKTRLLKTVLLQVFLPHGLWALGLIERKQQFGPPSEEYRSLALNKWHPAAFWTTEQSPVQGTISWLDQLLLNDPVFAQHVELKPPLSQSNPMLTLVPKPLDQEAN